MNGSPHNNIIINHVSLSTQRKVETLVQLTMDPALYKAAQQGNLHSLKSLIHSDPAVLTSQTPQENTALHIAARLGHKDFAEEILRHCNTLLVMANADEETPLHIAARAGHLGIVATLINYALVWPTDIDTDPPPLRMTNKMANMPLHEAVTHRHYAVAMKLLRSDPLVGHMPNMKKETPLHIAAREGIISVVREILQHPWVEGEEELQTASPLHQAVLGGHINVVEILLRDRRELAKVVDECGNNALHYAAKRSSDKLVEMLLRPDRSLAYMTNLEGRYPLHVAAEYGSTAAIRELLKNCPDTAEQVDGTGKNALHIAVMNRTVHSLKCLLKNIKPNEIINQVDSSGNTPLHLAAKNAKIQSTLLLLNDRRVDPCIANMHGLTARTIIESMDQMDTYELYIWRALRKSEASKCSKQRYGEVGLSRSFRKKLSNADEHFKSSAETYTVVAALIATVAFSATFTMPGGYNQSTGMAILAKQAAFKAFVISNTIAMCSSLIVVFCFIWAWKDPVRFKLNQLKWGHRLTVIACLAMLVTVTTAVYQVVAKECLWLAIVVCLICLSAPFIVCAILGHEVLFIPL